MDVTYIPMACGFVYLAVVLDWFSRWVLSWRVSITMETAFCIETLEEALVKHGKPEVFNTDQGSQLTGAAFTGLLIKNGITISTDRKGAWRDNVFVERGAASNTRRCISGPRQRVRGPHTRFMPSGLIFDGNDQARSKSLTKQIRVHA